MPKRGIKPEALTDTEIDRRRLAGPTPSAVEERSHLSLPGLPRSWLFPTTRYRGSKRAILPWIWSALREIEFDTALDVFGGTASVSVLMKRMGKAVTCNDILHFNHQSAIAFVSNNRTLLSPEDIRFVVSPSSGHGRTISTAFKGYYFTDSENQWLDRAVCNILRFAEWYDGKELGQKQALAFWALGQACLIKRPFNLFHRRNLALRLNEVARSFGNKKTWETPFPLAFSRFANEANQIVHSNGRSNAATRLDAFSYPSRTFDLVYLDPPYFFEGQRDVDYREMYHFLEGITCYQGWGDEIDYTSFNLRLRRNGHRWPHTSAAALEDMYARLISRFSSSTIVISHKSGSRVSVGTLRRLLAAEDKLVRAKWRRYNYALSKNNGAPRQNIEWLLIGV